MEVEHSRESVDIEIDPTVEHPHCDRATRDEVEASAVVVERTVGALAICSHAEIPCTSYYLSPNYRERVHFQNRLRASGIGDCQAGSLGRPEP
jgi:hypothetical protein